MVNDKEKLLLDTLNQIAEAIKNAILMYEAKLIKESSEIERFYNE